MRRAVWIGGAMLAAVAATAAVDAGQGIGPWGGLGYALAAALVYGALRADHAEASAKRSIHPAAPPRPQNTSGTPLNPADPPREVRHHPAKVVVAP